MISFNRYPHVRSIIEHYALKLNDKIMIEILQDDIANEKQAEHLARFVWLMLDQMRIDTDNKKYL